MKTQWVAPGTGSTRFELRLLALRLLIGAEAKLPKNLEGNQTVKSNLEVLPDGFPVQAEPYDLERIAAAEFAD